VIATRAGVLSLDAERIRRANEIDEAATVSTLRPDAPVRPGTLVATAKVTPFATPQAIVDACTSAATGSTSAIGIDPFRSASVALAPEDVLDAGGLLEETTHPPEPRRRRPRDPAPASSVAGVVLAAGRSSRMGNANKLLQDVEGTPMVRRVVETAIDGRLSPVVVVLGHEAETVRGALAGLPVAFVENPDHGGGISTSIRRGIAAVAGAADGAMILLGDMPWVGVHDLEALVAAFRPDAGCGICAPVADRRRGNPVVWAARYFPELRALEGDVGARRLLAVHEDDVCEVPVPSDGVLRDVDTPGALKTHTRKRE
jgi:molybdenum cofactor cytidylyltransferase